MSIAIAFENDDVVWVDAVIGYNESLSGRVTEHPVEDGSVISDTVIKDAPAFALSGIISNADLMFGRPLDIQNYRGVLNQTSFEPVKISGNKPGKLSKLLPESVSFFVSEDTPSVEFEQQSNDFAGKVKERFRQAHANGEGLTLIEYDFGTIKEMQSDLYVQNVNFNEGPDTGDALEFSLSLTRVVKVTLQSAKVGSVAASMNYGSNASGGAGSTTNKEAPANFVEKASANGPKELQSTLDWLAEKGTNGIEYVTTGGGGL